jgi:hypothetical protein
VGSAGRCSTEYREESRLLGRRALKKRRPLMTEWVLYCKTPKATNPPDAASGADGSYGRLAR